MFRCSRLIATIFALCLLARQTSAEDETLLARSQLMSDIGQVRALAVNSPRPEYPYAARAQRMTGKGIAVLDIDSETGRVTTARMAVSTGHQLLDGSALSAFRQWRFKPGTVTKVKIPIAFTMSSAFAAPPTRKSVPLPNAEPAGIHSISGGPDAVALYKPAPGYPPAAQLRHLVGNGVAIVEIDPKTGRVTSAEMNPSTGHDVLDAAALKAFRQWRFKPGTGGKFKIPVTYKLR